MRCSRVRNELTAFAEAGLRSTTAAKVRAHVDTCEACARELRSIRRSIELQRTALGGDLPDLSFGFETRLNARIEEAAQERAPWFRSLAWTWKPAVVVAVAGIAVLVAAGPLREPKAKAVLIQLGIKSPPRELAREPELYRDYPIIEHLEELENFETVNTLRFEEEILGQPKGSA